MKNLAKGGRKTVSQLGIFFRYHLQAKVFHSPALFKGSVHGPRDL